MAEWKKVIVSGSTAQLATLQVGSNQQIGTTQATTFLTGSFTGSFKGDGSQLSGLTSGTLTSITAGTGLSGGTITTTGTIAIDSTVATLTGTQTLTNKTLTAPVIATIVNNSNTLTLPTTVDTLVGRATTDTLTNKTLTAPVISTITNSGTLTLPTGTDTLIGKNTTDTLSNKTLTAPVISTISNTGTLTLPTATDTLVGRATTDTLTNKTLTSPTISSPTISGTAALATLTVSGNATIAGDLFVNGTTTQINTTDLLVEDKFILLASGSVDGTGDAGIIIDRGSDALGNVVFGFDATTDRWGYQNGLSDSTNAIVIGTNGNSAFAGYVFTEGAHTSTKPTTGEFVTAGSIYTNSDGTIWMYA